MSKQTSKRATGWLLAGVCVGGLSIGLPGGFVGSLATTQAQAQEATEANAALLTDTPNLRPVLHAGQSAHYSLWSDRVNDVTLTNGQQARTVSQGFRIEGEIAWEVLSVQPDGTAKCQMTYDWLEATVRGPEGQEMVNDSRKGQGPTPPLHGFLKALAGKPLTITVKPDGTLDNLGGMGAVRSAMPSPDAAPEEIEILSTMRTLAILDQPPAQIKTGGSWKIAVTMPHEAGEMDYDTRYTLQSVGLVEGVPIATLSTDDKLTFKPELPPTPPGVTATVKLTDSDSHGMVMYDLDRHETAGRHEYEKTVIESKISAQGQTMVQTNQQIRQSQLLRISESSPRRK